MSRSCLQPHRAAILEAVAAGTGTSALAKTYGVAKSTMHEFLNGYPNRHNPLKKCQYDTLVAQPRRTRLSRQQAEETL